MKRIVFLLVSACTLPFPGTSSLAQRLDGAYSGKEGFGEPSLTWGAHAGISYLIHQKKFLRQNYDNAFPIFALDFPPLGLELGVLYRLTSAIDLMMDAGARKHILKANEGLQNEGTLHIFPASIVFRHVWRFQSGEKPYLAFGGAVYWSRFTSTLLITGELDPTPLGEYRFVKNDFGVGAIGEAGFLERLSPKLYLDLGIRYDFTRLGNPKDGGLGNIGGVQLKLKTIHYF
jgi:hypothetical protein